VRTIGFIFDHFGIVGVLVLTLLVAGAFAVFSAVDRLSK
jgi:hypothetical protein